MGTKSQTYQERAAQVIQPDNEVGKIKRPYGERTGGELLIGWYGGDSSDYDFETEPLWVEIDSLAVPLFVSTWRSQGAKGAVVLFADFERAEEAALLIGKKLYAENPADSEEDTPEEPYAGYTLTDRVTGKKGRVEAYYDYPNNPLLGVVFEGESQETLVPAALIDNGGRNDKKQKLEVDLPEGLLGL